MTSQHDGAPADPKAAPATSSPRPVQVRMTFLRLQRPGKAARAA